MLLGAPPVRLTKPCHFDSIPGGATSGKSSGYPFASPILTQSNLVLGDSTVCDHVPPRRQAREPMRSISVKILLFAGGCISAALGTVLAHLLLLWLGLI